MHVQTIPKSPPKIIVQAIRMYSFFLFFFFCYNFDMKEFLLGLLDWIYKKKCYFCRSSKECSKMCSKCFNELDYLATMPNRITEGVVAAKQTISSIPFFLNSLIISSKVEPVVQMSSIIRILPL